MLRTADSVNPFFEKVSQPSKQICSQVQSIILFSCFCPRDRQLLPHHSCRIPPCHAVPQHTRRRRSRREEEPLHQQQPWRPVRLPQRCTNGRGIRIEGTKAQNEDRVSSKGFGPPQEFSTRTFYDGSVPRADSIFCDAHWHQRKLQSASIASTITCLALGMQSAAPS